MSDHNSIEAHTNIEKSSQKKKTKSPVHLENNLKNLNFLSASVNWKLLDEDLKRIDRTSMSDCETIEEMFGSFMKDFEDLCKKHVPRKRVKS